MIFIACQYVLVQWKIVLIVAQNVKQLDVYREEFYNANPPIKICLRKENYLRT